MEHTYVVQCQESLRFKVGRARDPRKRFEHLQIGSPSELRLIGCLAVSEAEAHGRLSRWRYRGEWFLHTEHSWAIVESMLLQDGAQLSALEPVDVYDPPAKRRRRTGKRPKLKMHGPELQGELKLMVAIWGSIPEAKRVIAEWRAEKEAA